VKSWQRAIAHTLNRAAAVLSKATTLLGTGA